MSFVKYDFGGATLFEETELTDQALAAAIPGATNIFVQAAPFVDAVRPSALAKVTPLRNAKEAGGFIYNGKSFDSDERACARIVGAKLLADEVEKVASGSFTVDWTCADNTIVTLNHAAMAGLFTALGQHIITTHVAARAVKTAIEAATTVEEIEAALATLA